MAETNNGDFNTDSDYRNKQKQSYYESNKQSSNFRGSYRSGIPKYDWVAISQEYIRGFESIDPITGDNVRIFPTFEDISIKYGCHLDTLQKRAKKDKWFLQRNQFLRLVRAKATEIDLNDLFSINAKLDSQAIETLENIHTITNEILRPYVMAAQGDDVDISELKPLTTNDLRNLVNTTKEAVLLARAITTGENNKQTTINITESLAPGTTQTLPPNPQQTKKRIKQLTSQLLEAEVIKAEIEKRKQNNPPSPNPSEYPEYPEYSEPPISP
jgi:hypothetical protein